MLNDIQKEHLQNSLQGSEIILLQTNYFKICDSYICYILMTFANDIGVLTWIQFLG